MPCSLSFGSFLLAFSFFSFSVLLVAIANFKILVFITGIMSGAG
jgi:hypothetical protein